MCVCVFVCGGCNSCSCSAEILLSSGDLGAVQENQKHKAEDNFERKRSRMRRKETEKRQNEFEFLKFDT